MALLHRAEIRPTKLELLARWLPTRRWYDGQDATVSRVSAFRFDDPAGAVGIETILVRRGDGPVLQVPLTYRGAPLDGGGLVGTTEHSVLGRRWVYDGCTDPVYASVLASAISGATGQAQEFFDVEGQLVAREATMSVTGGTSPDTAASAVETVRHAVDGDDHTLIATDSVELTVVRRLDPSRQRAGATLTGAWSDQPTPVLLAYASH